MTQYLSKFKFAEKFESLPDIQLDGRGGLRFENTKIDMIPAGLKGITFVYFTKKPRYIAPDFDGIVVCYDPKGIHHIADMDKLEIETAKARYVAEREKVEKPRYVREKDGTLSLCSLPTNMQVLYKQFEGGYFLDLTRTSIREKQNLAGFKNIILEPKKPVQQELGLIFPKRITHRHKPQMVHSKPRIKE